MRRLHLRVLPSESGFEGRPIRGPGSPACDTWPGLFGFTSSAARAPEISPLMRQWPHVDSGRPGRAARRPLEPPAQPSSAAQRTTRGGPRRPREEAQARHQADGRQAVGAEQAESRREAEGGGCGQAARTQDSAQAEFRDPARGIRDAEQSQRARQRRPARSARRAPARRAAATALLGAGRRGARAARAPGSWVPLRALTAEPSSAGWEVRSWVPGRDGGDRAQLGAFENHQVGFADLSCQGAVPGGSALPTHPLGGLRGRRDGANR